MNGNGRKGKKRLNVWLPETHPIFNIKPGERTRAIQNLGNLEIALSLIGEMKGELLDKLSTILQSSERIEKALESGCIKADVSQVAESEPPGSDIDAADIYKSFGGLRTVENNSASGAQKKRRKIR